MGVITVLHSQGVGQPIIMERRDKMTEQANLCPYCAYPCSKVIEDCETCLMFLESTAKRNADVEAELRTLENK